MYTQVPQADWHSGGPWICGSWCNGGRQLGALGSLCEHMDPHTVASDVCLAMDIYGPILMSGDPLCGMDAPLDVIQAELLMHSGVRGC